MTNDLLGQLEHSYETRKGYWKGGTVSVYGYGGGIIPRFSEVGKAFPKSKEFHTLRVQPPAGNHYSTAMLRQLADSWEKHGSGLVTFHGQTGNIMFIGADTEATQHFFDEINDYGWDLGGAGPCVRTAMSCVGAARCEMSCTNELKAHRMLVNNFVDDVHRPALPYKFKFKVSGCANDCQNAIERADFAVLGTWRDDMKVDQDEVKAYVKAKGRQYVIDNVITRCPTQALSLNDDDTLAVNNRDCVRCMHCLNVMPKALHPGDDKGVTILIGGKRTLKIGDLMGTVVVPFRKLETEEDYEEMVETRREHHRLLGRERPGARALRRDDRAHRPGQLPRRHRYRARPEHAEPPASVLLCPHGRLGRGGREWFERRPNKRPADGIRIAAAARSEFSALAA
jgi:sulfite reductase alpha subunit